MRTMESNCARLPNATSDLRKSNSLGNLMTDFNLISDKHIYYYEYSWMDI